MRALEVVTLGRIGVDLYPEEIGVGLHEASRFQRGLGGSPTNVAVGAARLGRSSAILTKVGDDPFGRYCLEALTAYGVDTRWVRVEAGTQTPIAFCEVRPPEEFPLFLYRTADAADLRLRLDEVDSAMLAAAGLVWTTGSGLSREPSRATTLAVMELRSEKSLTVHDLDFRPSMWAAGESPGEWGRRAVERCSVVVGNREEVALVVGERSPSDQAQALLELGPDLAVVKLGREGVLAATQTGDEIQVGAIEVEVVCGLGSGDAFGAALCHGLLSGWPLERMLHFANAAGAIVASRLLCAAAMPTLAEIRELIRLHGEDG